VVRERKALSVTGCEFWSLQFGVATLRFCFASCFRQHVLAEIESHDVRALGSKRYAQVPRAAAHVEGAVTRTRICQLCHAPFPTPMQPEAHDVIHEVVTWRDGV